MTEREAVSALQALPRGGVGQGTLARMRALLAALGDPQKDLKAVHIAGTNGKGSLAAMTAAILTSAGYKTGLTISPYVVDFRERFQIDGQMMPARALAPLVQKVLAAIEQIKAAGGTPPVQFEAVTAVAFLWFARQKCDIVVLETGLGGKTDATNVLPPENVLVAAITRIGLDHTELLGDTLAAIAAEKAGIIKKDRPVVCYPEQPPEAMAALYNAAAAAHTSLTVPEPDDVRRLTAKGLANRVDYGGYTVDLRLPGRHQALHAAMAVEIALTLWRRWGYDIPDEAILAGLESAVQPARIEVLRRHPLLLLDGCHNPDGAVALAQTLTDAGYAGRLAGVLGVLADKDAEAMLAALGPCFARLYTVAPPGSRALAAETLREKARYHTEGEVTAAESLPGAIRAAIAWADAHNLPGVVVCGSLYLAAQARPLLLRAAKK